MDIALAIVVDPERRRTLIAQRPPGVHLEGYWEFPGGKIEEETAAQCAVREALEETGLIVSVLEVWSSIAFDYPERSVNLHPVLCEANETASQRWVWVPIETLDSYRFPEANAAITQRLRDLASPLRG